MLVYSTADSARIGCSSLRGCAGSGIVLHISGIGTSMAASLVQLVPLIACGGKSRLLLWSILSAAEAGSWKRLFKGPVTMDLTLLSVAFLVNAGFG